MTFFALSFLLVNSQTTVTQTFDASQSYTIPPDITSITVRAWGGGGGGGGGNNASALRGGGGGAYSQITLTVAPGNVYTITVGDGGISTSNPGGTGGDTSFSRSGTTYVLAKGGIGGGSATGLGGLASAGIGTTKYSGGNGGSGGGGNGGGGGGSAGSSGAGGAGGAGVFGSGGSGGVAGAGTPGGAAGGAGGTRGFLGGAGAGTAGAAPGAGGGGRSSSLFTSNTAGGAGAKGRVTITYTTPSMTDLRITKTSSNPNPLAGDIVTFTLMVTNLKTTVPAQGTVLTDLLPSGYTFISANQPGYDKTTGVWNIGTLAGSASVTLTITALVKDTGVYNNTATVNSVTPDDSTINNTATATITVCKGGSTAPQVKQ